jgi:hypothetical protein
MTRAYCPLCSKGFHFKLPKRLTSKHMLQVGLTSFIAMWLLWPFLGIKGLVIFIPFWIVFEVAFRLQKRQQVVCPHCAFDPVLYKRSPVLARQKVELFWAQKMDVPAEAEGSSGTEADLVTSPAAASGDQLDTAFNAAEALEGDSGKFPEKESTP